MIVTAAGAKHECLHLEYAENAKLYLPVENIDLLSRYGHEEGLLDRLGGGAWQAKKARLRQRIKEIAEKLMRVAAERALRKAAVMEPPPDMWAAFCARFPYTETDDQLAAIAAVTEDLAMGSAHGSAGVRRCRLWQDRGSHARRLCRRPVWPAGGGDCPHHLAGAATYPKFPRPLSRLSHNRSAPCRGLYLPKILRPPAMVLGRGAVDIVVGTHAVLAKSVRFQNLGLLIIDEEQRFGVAHKERLKELRSDVHVLTLTATPIPRTLQLSLTGVRDLSIIGTPPVDRLAIRTYVSEFDTVTIREALFREHYRGGQSFIVVPRIADIAEMEGFLTGSYARIDIRDRPRPNGGGDAGCADECVL